MQKHVKQTEVTVKKGRSKDSVLMKKDYEIVVEVRKEKSRWNAYDQRGNKVTAWVQTGQRQKAHKKGMALRRLFYKDGRPYWRMVEMSEFRTAKSVPFSGDNNFKSDANLSTTESLATVTPVVYTNSASVADIAGVYTPLTTQADVIDFIRKSYDLKPKKVFVSELKWKHLIRTIIRGKNTMVVGMQGAGKTLVAKTAAMVIGRPYFSFPLGETQDPKAYLLGSTHYDKDSGTVFYPSRFIRAIQTKGAIIHLDELSRAHPDAWNILMSVLDYTQRYVVLDESRDNAVIKVAEGVTFIATANIGSEFTATRVMDRALSDRFTFIEMDILTKEQETELLKMLYPSLDETLLAAVADIATTTREEVKSATPKLTTSISTRLSVETAGLLYDGFTLAESAEVSFYPFFSEDGGMDSERTYVKMLVQRYVDDGASMPFDPNAVKNAPTKR
jgi:MoxR-like ATPase